MTSWIKQRANLRYFGYLAVSLAIGIAFESDVAGTGLAQVIEAKSLPEATVEVVDPESGSSGGTGSVFGVKLEVGDVILFRFSFAPVPDKRNRGIQSYITDYIPENTEVVGARIIDESGLTIEPRYPGLALDGCETCNAPFNLTAAGDGSIAQLHADTGVFFVDDAATAPAGAELFQRYPGQVFPEMDNGLEMNPEPNHVGELLPLLETSSPIYAHNEWDWIQVQAFGIKNAPIGTSGAGNLPEGYGSPVAGPHSRYQFQATAPHDGTLDPSLDTQLVTHSISLDDDPGPWTRIQYPGSKIGFEDAGGQLDEYTRMIADAATLGADVTPANPADARAVRWALGDPRTGEPQLVEIALRVTGLPIDPDFLGGPGEHLNCGEVIGSDLSQRRSGGSSNDGENHPWGKYIGAPACAFLRLKLDVTSDVELANGTNVDYTISGKNLSVNPETNATLYLVFADNRLTYQTSTPAPDSPAGDLTQCPPNFDAGSKQCLRFDLGTLDPSEEFSIQSTHKAGGSGHTTGNMTAVYVSDQLDDGSGNPIPYATRDIVVIAGIAVPKIALEPGIDPTWDTAAGDPDDGFVPSGGGTFPVGKMIDAARVGSISNAGNNEFTLEELNTALPAGWTLENDEIFVGGSAASCTQITTDLPVSGTPQDFYRCTGFADNTFSPGESQDLSFNVVVPSGQDGLHDIDFQIWHSQQFFGGQMETYFPKLATIPVGLPRAEKPVVSCPIGSTDTEISGTSEPNADIRLFFNLIERGDGTADGSGNWTVDNFVQNFGSLYGGLEVRATAKIQDVTLESELSDVTGACVGGVEGRRACSDGLDNDGDGWFDFPADPGCDSLTDNDEGPDPQCFDGIDNNGDCPAGNDENGDGTVCGNGDLNVDWPNDPSCTDPFDDTEDGDQACADGDDNDGDGQIDGADTDCAASGGRSEAELSECMNFVDDGDPEDTLADWGEDPGCHADFDDDESDPGFTPEELRARLLVVFDTSGSMNNNTCTEDFTGGDGSTQIPGAPLTCDELIFEHDCKAICSDGVDNDSDGLTDFGSDPGCASASDNTELDGSNSDPPAAFTLCQNDEADDSRMYQVKAGLSQAVANFGEVDWGLMRFRQRPMMFSPPDDGWLAGEAFGGWQGGGNPPPDDGAPACQLFNEGELLADFSFDNASTILDWMDGDTNYAPEPDMPPPGLDQELRGTGTTPLAGSLQSAYDELQALKSGDSRPCRPYRVILVTDGLETCDGDPVAKAQALFDEGIPVIVIGFSTPDPEVRNSLNAIAQAGSGGQDDAIFVDNQQSLAAAFTQIVDEALVFETCNGVDDDCDFEVDEDFPNLGDTCSAGLEGSVCESEGTFVCSTGPDGVADTGDELSTVCDAVANPPNCSQTPSQDSEACVTPQCNGDDDDCDGKIDEGLDCDCVEDFEICNGISDDCDSAIDENPTGVEDSNGDPIECGTDNGICEKGTVQCVDPDGDPGTADSSLECVGGVGPEIGDPCDGVDNDCDCPGDTNGDGIVCGPGDDNVDEGPLPACYDIGDGGCVPDGNGGFDCNGFCTPGVYSCPDGSLGACVGDLGGNTEVCDGIDNNCSGVADDPWKPDGDGNSPGDACDNDGIGACFATGQYTCDPSDPENPLLVCDAPNITEGAEVCNSEDDDCDGEIDEGDGTTPAPPDGLGHPIGKTCGGPGCSPGTFACIDHDMDPGTPNEIRCTGTMGGSDEVCNAADDDCDGKIDEFVAGVGAECYPADLDGCTENIDGTFDCEGECAPGATICIPPEIVCDDHDGPAPNDTCDGLDNDCDGQIDEDPCPGGSDICVEGQCVVPCELGEFPCSFGFVCHEFEDEACGAPPCRFCVPDPCNDVTCDSESFCDSDTGECVNYCEGISCRDGETCIGGLCYDCFDPGQGCAGDCEVCEQDASGVGQCVTDLCCDVECDDGQFCREGECVQASCDPECPAGEACVDGECVEDSCGGVECPGGQVCNPNEGGCVTDLCQDVSCPPGEVCHPGTGMCVGDPCSQVACPDGFECVIDFDGEGRCRTPAKPEEERIYAAGGGCAVSGGGSAPSSLALLLIGLGWMWRRRSSKLPRS